MSKVMSICFLDSYNNTKKVQIRYFCPYLLMRKKLGLSKVGMCLRALLPQ